jgi:elongation factor Ts
MQVAAMRPAYLTRDDVPADVVETEKRVAEAKAREDGKPEDVIPKIVEGQLAKWARDVALLEQEHVRSDRYEGKTIEELRAELAAKTGENVRVARFARFQVGESG